MMVSSLARVLEAGVLSVEKHFEIVAGTAPAAATVLVEISTSSSVHTRAPPAPCD
jgi:hypothetical protein